MELSIIANYQLYWTPREIITLQFLINFIYSYFSDEKVFVEDNKQALGVLFVSLLLGSTLWNVRHSTLQGEQPTTIESNKEYLDAY